MVASGLAWSVPALVASQTVPVVAASLCLPPAPVTVNWRPNDTHHNMAETAPSKIYSDRLTITSDTGLAAGGHMYVTGNATTSSPLRGDTCAARHTVRSATVFRYALPLQYVAGNNSAFVQFQAGVSSFTMRLWNADPSSATDPLAEQSFSMDDVECEPTPCPTGPSGRPIASRLS